MGNAYKRFEEELVATTPAIVLTVPVATTAVIKSILVSNTSGNSANITVTFAPGGVGTHPIVPSQALAHDHYTDLLAGSNAGPLILEAADTLSVTSSQSSVFVVVSALLVDRT